jgi:hypothetical protein
MSVLLFAKSFEAQKGHKEARDFSLLRKRGSVKPSKWKKGEFSRPASIFIRRRQEKAWN